MAETTGSLKLDLVFSRTQGGGNITLGGESFDLILQRPLVYIKADTATWKKAGGISPAIATRLNNKWFYVSSTNKGYSAFTSLLDLTTLLGHLSTSKGLTKGAVTTFRGMSAIPLTHSTSTIYIAATGPPYILGLTRSGSEKGIIVFSDYNSAKAPTAPAGAVSLLKAVEG